MWHSRILGVVTLLACISACDPQSTNVSCSGQLEILRPLQDVTFNGEQDAILINLEGDSAYFNDSHGGELTYEARSSYSRVVAVENTGERGHVLKLIPGQEGQATVFVRASNGCLRSAELSFSANVADQCPSSLSEEEVNYLPLEVGNRWVYDYTSIYTPAFAVGETRIVGMATWEVTAKGYCRAGKQPYDLLEVIDGRRQVWVHTPDQDSLGWQDGEAYHAERTFTVVQGDSMNLGPYTHEAIPWRSTTYVDTLIILQKYSPEFASAYSILLRLVPDQGMVSWSQNVILHRDSKSVRMVLRAGEGHIATRSSGR